MQPSLNEAILFDPDRQAWRVYRRPRALCVARALADVLPVLQRAEAAAAAGLHAVGFVAYEAASAFDAALSTRAPSSIPLAWFAIYDTADIADVPRLAAPPAAPAPAWQPTLTREEHAAALDAIRRYLHAGDTYQVNFTFRLRTALATDAWASFAPLLTAAEAPFAAFIETDDFSVCSLSPELFFTLDGRRLVSRPMKGTAPRGRWLAEDRAQAAGLHASEKNRAENVMIVDMIRNDMGRVATSGTVDVTDLYRVERYPTVWQMTSTVTADTDAGLCDIFKAMFPCASVTGAPKRRTMEIIAELENAPRGLYTGCIGSIAPGRRARFNVAIRTIVADKARATAEYGVGGGIVWDSTAGSEYEECLTKAAALSSPRPAFDLFETLLWTPGQGYRLLDEHLARLRDSAQYFGFVLDLAAVRARLAEEAAAWGSEARRVRLTANREGALHVESSPAPTPPAHQPRVSLAPRPVDSREETLFHKTTSRAIYESARAACPGASDVILWNERGEVTESTIANIIVEIGGRRYTPPVACGLLAGTWRQRLLERGEVRERVIRKDELARADLILLCNSVRGEWAVTLQPPG